MKKEYKKPEIMFEDFTLSTNIAGSCDVKTNTPRAETCGMPMSGGTTIFMEGISGCETIAIDGSYNICYHVPIDTANLFNS